MIEFTVLLLFTSISSIQTLNNGLARTPPMGWLSWERFRCNTDCKNFPDSCISEKLYRDMIDRIASDGYLDVGYEYVNIDDCWSSKERDSNNRLRPDPERFPNGIKALADYAHSKGVKLGIYTDVGSNTCGGYPGSEYYMEIDSQTFAEWGIDSLKVDGCYSDPKQMDEAYPILGKWLNLTGRPILYSCSWPAYQEGNNIKPNYPLIAQTCNIWRNYDDIQDSFDSVAGIIKFYGDDRTSFREVAGPGNFNDPDMLILGNFGLSYDQQRVQMAMWCLMASPMLMSADLRNIKSDSKALLLNKNAIQINQDSLGVQGKRVLLNGNIQVWSRPINPAGSFAFTYLYFGTDMPTVVNMTLAQLGFTNSKGYKIYEVFDTNLLGKFLPSDSFAQVVNPTGVFFGKAILLS